MSYYLPNTGGISQGLHFRPGPISKAFFDLEKAINGKVEVVNFEEPEVLGLRSFHERSLSETARGRQLIWNEIAVWVFAWRHASTVQNFDDLGEHANKFTVEEAATRVLVPHSCKVHVSAQIQIESVKFSGKDQSDVLSATSLATVAATSSTFSAEYWPGLRLDFSLLKSEPGSGTLLPGEMDKRRVQIKLEENTGASGASVGSPLVESQQAMRRGVTVNLVGVDNIVLTDEEVRTGKAMDYYVEVVGSFVEGARNIATTDVVYATVRSTSRHITATTYNATYLETASTGIGD